MLTVWRVDLSAMIYRGERTSCTSDNIDLPGLDTVNRLEQRPKISRQSYAIDLCLMECRFLLD